MSVANIDEYMNKLSSLFDWAVKEEIIHRNPARGLRVMDTRMARDKRLPFESWQLEKDDMRWIRDCERSEAIQCPGKTLWIASLRSQ